MKIKSKLLLNTIVVALSGQYAMASEFVQIDPVALNDLKVELKENKAVPLISDRYQDLLKDADKNLTKKNPSVMDKTIMPPSNDKHDYLSISRYWWPDSSKADGLPWIRKDGITNPDTQSDDVDRPRISRMSHAVYNLSLAYYLSGNEEYAEKAVSMVKTWFIDPETKMNPNLNYAQSVPGYNEGRRAGILDGRFIQTQILDSIKILENSKSWTKEDQEQMNTWLEQHLDWLTKSDIGIAGAKQTNNHGTWYRFQVSSLAYFLGEDDIVKQTINETKDSMKTQFATDGSQPEELARTRSFFYSGFNLNALSRVAIVADKFGDSIWQYQPEKGKSIKAGFNFILPVVHGEKWNYATPGIKLEYLIPALVKYNQYNPNDNFAKELQIITGYKGTDVQEVYNQLSILENNEM
ncbi:alginate lyase family protein [Vibrio aphrogenes]|uniref:alginate lyase family protein n=1 Tax=Vibrio aphrogenes TaxID=1891186 RepID=UPI000B352F0F|nr:alginate lyase family protein [Vibrio aphrogenes]